MSSLDPVLRRVLELRSGPLFREPRPLGGRDWVSERALALGRQLINACSNDYLGHAAGVSRETNPGLAPLGAGSSRLIHGTRQEHEHLEAELAEWVTQPAALLFTSGYAANVGTVSALATQEDVILSDALNHASLVDGCRLSRARTEIVAHNDTAAMADALERNRSAHCWVVTESYFSMDGDSPDLRTLRSLCDQHNAALVVDEAHALGVFGESGSGICSASSVAPDVLVGTFGKSVGAQGAFVASTEFVRDWLWNKARSYVFSTAMSPRLAQHITDRIALVRADEEGRRRLSKNVSILRARLKLEGVKIPAGSHGPIIPIILGTPERAATAATKLGELGILAQAIRPPTVPPDSCRLRITVTAAMTTEEVNYLTECLVNVCRQS